ncbi:hypothetical protein HG826_07600 [Streptomyces sp. GMY01]|uniref:hypothetical protein n=1 Tax=Streptomyces sp. GMY02 TaxID=1333528 RepID=UPI00146AC4F4|nr:hypothetical protein [Streptomyces sp. GMY02]NMO33454.1 hypothetical protein [Streptomyces sp. GMY02]
MGGHRAIDREDEGRERDIRPSGSARALVALGLCVIGGGVLAGAAGLVLGLPLPLVVVTALVIGVGTWLPLVVRGRPPQDGDSQDRTSRTGRAGAGPQ